MIETIQVKSRSKQKWSSLLQNFVSHLKQLFDNVLRGFYQFKIHFQTLDLETKAVTTSLNRLCKQKRNQNFLDKN